MSLFVQQNSVVSDFSVSGSWVILSSIEQSIKRKIEAVGIPLKDWNISINYGIKTGLNEAFIINKEKRDEILSNCKTEEERKKTDELIRPILRGRDIKRYGYEWAGLYLINSHNGIKEKGISRIDVEKDYPAVKKHLDEYWDKIKNRYDKGDSPYNLRNCAYMEEFNKPKIVWGEISDKAKFAYDDNGKFIPEATTFLLTGKNLAYLFCILNSSFSEWFFSKIGTTTGVGTVRWKKYTIQELLIPSLLEDEIKNITNLVEMFLDKKISLTTLQETINTQIYKAIELNDEEIKCINAQT